MVSRLFYNEQGRIGLDDFVGDKTPATRFELASRPRAAEVFVAAKKLRATAAALRLEVNSREYSLDAAQTGSSRWLCAALAPDDLQSGENLFTIRAQPDWCVAVEPQSVAPLIRLRVECDDGEANKQLLPRYGDAAIEANCDE